METATLSFGIAIALFILGYQFTKWLLTEVSTDENSEDMKIWEQSTLIANRFDKIKNARDISRLREDIHAFRNIQDGNTARQGYAHRLELILNKKILKTK